MIEDQNQIKKEQSQENQQSEINISLAQNNNFIKAKVIQNGKSIK